MIKNNSQLNNEEGFSIIEVLVALLVLVGFMLGTLQAMVFSALILVRTQEKAEVLNWIEEDLEIVKYHGLVLDKNEIDVMGNVVGYDMLVCNNSSYGTELSNELDIIATYPNTISIAGKDYRIYRQKNPVGNTLEIEYTVAYHTTHPRYNSSDSYSLTTPPTDSNTNFITSLSTTEMPNAALKCP